jgi:hypothetical protein
MVLSPAGQRLQLQQQRRAHARAAQQLQQHLLLLTLERAAGDALGAVRALPAAASALAASRASLQQLPLGARPARASAVGQQRSGQATTRGTGRCVLEDVALASGRCTMGSEGVERKIAQQERKLERLLATLRLAHTLLSLGGGGRRGTSACYVLERLDMPGPR